MKKRDLNKYCLKTIKREKKNSLKTIILVTLATALILCSYSVVSILNGYISNTVNNNLNYRTVSFNYELQYKTETILEQTKEIPHVLEVFEGNEFFTVAYIEEFSSNKTDGDISLYAMTKNTIPKIIKGSIPNQLEDNYIICSSEIIGDSYLYNRTDLTKKDYIDTTQYLNKTLTLSYKNFEKDVTYQKKVKLIATYNFRNYFAEANVCFASPNLIYEINKTVLYGDTTSDEIYGTSGVYAIVNSSENTNEVIKKINASIGYNAHKTVSFDTSIIILINFCVFAIIAGVIVAMIFIVSNFTKKDLINASKEIGILKSIGYTNKDIENIECQKTNIKTFIGFILGIMIYTILFLIAKSVIDNGPLVYTVFEVKYEVLCIIIIFIMLKLLNRKNVKKVSKYLNSFEIINVLK